jgi:hypothetical protein
VELYLHSPIRLHGVMLSKKYRIRLHSMVLKHGENFMVNFTSRYLLKIQEITLHRQGESNNMFTICTVLQNTLDPSC